MDSIKRLVDSTIGVALQLTGIAYNVQQEGKLSEDKLKMMSQLTDNISINMEDAKKEIVCIENKLKDKTKRIEYLSKDNALHKRKLAEAHLEVDELSSTCKKLKTDLTSSQETFKVVSFQDDFDDQTTPDISDAGESQDPKSSQPPDDSEATESHPQGNKQNDSESVNMVKESSSQKDLFCE
jgi:hypothetical protein